MADSKDSSERREKLLFTPGPLTTSRTVKEAMLRDLGSRDAEFVAVVREIRGRLLDLAGVRKGEYEAIPMQGSGTFAIESVLSSCIPREGVLFVPVNGAYGRRIAEIAERLGIETRRLEFPEEAPIHPAKVREALETETGITHLAAVHLETTTGVLNPAREIGESAARFRKVYILDSMSAFGGVPIDPAEAGVDFLVSSANKCIEGVPGFGFVLARTEALLAARGISRSVSLDLFEQWKGLETNGQFRFTPPTHSLLAFHRALLELEAEGGVEGRARRYRENHETLLAGMRRLGFLEYLKPEHQGTVITSFRYPEHARFSFEVFYEALGSRGFAIYPGKTSAADCFRIGTIGRIHPEDVRALVAAIEEVLEEMGVSL